jgi:hypothetical protein
LSPWPVAIKKGIGRRGGVALDPAEQFVTVLVGHVPVADDQVDLAVPLEDANGLVPVHRFDDTVKPQCFEGLDFNFPHDCGVFNQQDLDILGIKGHCFPQIDVVGIQRVSHAAAIR